MTYNFFYFPQAFASLGANDEDIRKKIIETEGLMDHVVCGLQDASPGVRLAAIRCLHSLSRSVQQLRTTFQVYSQLFIKSNDSKSISPGPSCLEATDESNARL